MPVFAEPRDALIDRALHDARRWCGDETIDGEPAYALAIAVADTLATHLGDDLTVPVAAAGLLHASPRFAPPELNLEEDLVTRYGHPVRRIVRAVHAEDEALRTGAGELDISTADLHVLLVSTAHKIASLRAVLQRARSSGDEYRFLADHTRIGTQLPYFQLFTGTVTGLVPNAMSADLRGVLAAVTACRIF